ncbi:MAG TPA: Sec-independent protein translocase protein TatB [Alphaproteobacteria bacterium]|nr:Sec-independent protein translocase protein TatB [Alphaproteobacteria bacterium]
MFGIGWAELALIAIVAVLVIPPKDMPVIMRTLGEWTGKLRAMLHNARREFDSAMRIDDKK